MCLKTTQVVIEIIVVLYLTGVCRCLYIPSKSNDLIHNLMDTGKGEKSIQICGNHLTNLLVQICDGNFNEMSAGGGMSMGDNKLTEDCCKKQCPMTVLMQFCAEPTPKKNSKSLRPISNDIQQHPNLLDTRSRKTTRNETLTMRSNGSRKNSIRKPEVSVKKKNNKGKRSHTKRRRKTNNSITKNKKGNRIKMQCDYKSFGHYLLKRDPDIKTRFPLRKRKRNNTALPLQVETIPPNFESLGAMPRVVP